MYKVFILYISCIRLKLIRSTFFSERYRVESLILTTWSNHLVQFVSSLLRSTELYRGLTLNLWVRGCVCMADFRPLGKVLVEYLLNPYPSTTSHHSRLSYSQHFIGFGSLKVWTVEQSNLTGLQLINEKYLFYLAKYLCKVNMSWR